MGRGMKNERNDVCDVECIRQEYVALIGRDGITPSGMVMLVKKSGINGLDDLTNLLRRHNAVLGIILEVKHQNVGK